MTFKILKIAVITTFSLTASANPTYFFSSTHDWNDGSTQKPLIIVIDDKNQINTMRYNEVRQQIKSILNK